MHQDYYLGRALACAIVDGSIRLLDGKVVTEKTRIRNLCYETTTIIFELENDLIRRTESNKNGLDSIISEILEEYSRSAEHNQSDYYVSYEPYRPLISKGELMNWIRYCIDVHHAKINGIGTILLHMKHLFDWSMILYFHAKGEKITLYEVINGVGILTEDQHQWFCDRYCEQEPCRPDMEILLNKMKYTTHTTPNKRLFTTLFKTQLDLLTSTAFGPSFVQRIASHNINMWRYLVVECGCPNMVTIPHIFNGRTHLEIIQFI